MSRKIFISGPSGSGKTTLAKYIANRYRIPFISTSSKEIWPQFNVKSHAEIISKSLKDPEFAYKFQVAVLAFREHKLESFEEYVTDRAPLDNLVYFMNQSMQYVDENTTYAFYENVNNAYPQEDFVQIIIEVNKNTPAIVDDSNRITNRQYQEFISSIFRHTVENNILNNLRAEHAKVKVIRDYYWPTRVNIIDNLLDTNKINKFELLAKRYKELWERVIK